MRTISDSENDLSQACSNVNGENFRFLDEIFKFCLATPSFLVRRKKKKKKSKDLSGNRNKECIF